MTFFRCLMIILRIFEFYHLSPISKYSYRLPSSSFFRGCTARSVTSISAHFQIFLCVHCQNRR